MTTATQVLHRAARALGYLGRTDVMSAADANDALIAYNAMLDSWSNEGLLSYVILTRSFTLIPNQATYTIGTGGYIASTRPANIDSAFVRDSNHLDFKLDIVTKEQYDDIALKTNTSQIPNTLYYDSGYPLGTIYIFPVPTVAYSVFFDTPTYQVTASALTDTITMPVGYERAFVLNLALEMMSNGFPCMLNDRDYNTLVANAKEAKANIKNANIKDVEASYDPYLISNDVGTFNVYTNGYPRAG